MVFGFTNTRFTNYAPGDTIQPLERLLGEDTDAGLSLPANATYCFDLESFRHLAGSKKEICMTNKDDFERSWGHSRDETLRLIGHFKSILPHLRKSAMSPNGTRRSIQELTRPMADMSQMIRKNIAPCTDKKVELKDKRIATLALRANLRVISFIVQPWGARINAITASITGPQLRTLDNMVMEYEQEHDIIRDAAAKFSMFLKQHSITPINHATEAYLQFLIKAEQEKVEVGGNDEKLGALREDLKRNKEAVEVLTCSLNSFTTATAE
ncbi:uncharacterized protein Z519_07202 [Cladophialophora bantiana CBS 173.52]|uniref:Uncharacterized protein n=1 Tax=Cladophialophora bantiana (strain ATCC 10958 / CBS 173.52 / CDC B-1940 / NIH 8579) TaxID=1442370 RepID=A0A0D2HG15_CLAB1|nr:uncharacterized protein Z519_07202 [Cladophialophora bantiana CBS 173.52]KIW92218.1 hypothetical protein Z519_07202 [Cladophialophora bantiana CBS 173.52]